MKDEVTLTSRRFESFLENKFCFLKKTKSYFRIVCVEHFQCDLVRVTTTYLETRLEVIATLATWETRFEVVLSGPGCEVVLSGPDCEVVLSGPGCEVVLSGPDCEVVLSGPGCEVVLSGPGSTTE